MKPRAIVLAALALVPAVTPAEDNRGAAVFQQWCAHCHDTAPAAPGRLRLAWTRGKDKSILADRTDLDPAYIRKVVRRGQAEMPSFRRTEISKSDLQALVLWLTRDRAAAGAP